ncbi:MAG: signal peptidase I, partial [Candidatus Saccharibacteria bacterium]|nr:signal peptidase I [Candidatus Saccharibacteria bacterium]
MDGMKTLLKKHQGWIRLVVKIAVLALVLWLLFGVLIGFQRVEGVSMSNRVEDGDLVLFSRTDKTYYPDDVVLFERENETHVSSILASPGDIITIDEVGRLYVNGARVSDTAVYNIDQGETPTITFPVRVP